MRISVLIPVHNVATYIGEALESVLAQDAFVSNPPEGGTVDWECVCVDDGSVDGSAEILDAFARRDSRFHVIHQKNAGVSHARNVALDHAQGDWIVFLDGDDVLSPFLFRELAVGCRKFPDVQLLCYGRQEFSISRNLTWTSCPNVLGLKLVDLEYSIPDEFAGTALWQVSFRRDICGRFAPYKIGEDQLFLSDCLARGNRLVRIGKRLYGYRLRDGSAMRSVMDETKFDAILGYSSAMFRVFSASGKTIGRGLCRTRANLWLEGLPASVMEFPDKCLRSRLWKKYFDSMKTASSISLFTPWQKFVVKTLSCFRWRWLAVLLCVIPHQLKLRRCAWRNRYR